MLRRVAIVYVVGIVVQQVFGVVSLTNSVALDESDLVTDYYWREYTGIIPSDAIPGGIDKAGKRTYIGQMYSKTYGLLPATIYPGSKSALASGGGHSFRTEDYVKILCSRNHDKFRWIPTKNEETHLLTNCHLVIGGMESGYVLNIARVNHEMETIIGKVFAHHTPFKGLSIPYKDKEARYWTYEILTYNCNINICLNSTYDIGAVWQER